MAVQVAAVGLAAAVGAAVGAPDPTHNRRVAAFVGGLVADAAAMPLHWIYDTAEIASILKAAGREGTPEFLSPSHAPFYNYPVGTVTPFGDQTVVYAEALATAGSVDPVAIAAAYEAYYTPPMNTSRPYKSYYDHATKDFLANYAAGKRWPHTGGNDSETNAVAHVLPVAVMRAGRPGFLRDAEAAIRIVQDNDDAVAFGLTFARILERVILGDSVVTAIRSVAATLRNGTGNPNDGWLAHGLAKMDEWAPRPPVDVTSEVGQSCDFPYHAFTGPHLLLHYGGSPTFEAAVRQTILLGGENANRGTFIAALLAAAAGSVEAGVPKAWLAKTTHGAEYVALGHKLAAVGERSSASNPAADSDVASVVQVPTAVRRDTPPSHPDDIAGLSALYNSAGGPGWERNGGWLNTSMSVCGWDNVECNATTGRVSLLRLAGSRLAGTLPPELSRLTALVEFQVGFNPLLTGPIPDGISKMSALQKFYAWNASLTAVPADFGELPSLVAVDLTDNALAGQLPGSLVNLKTVNTAYFDGNPSLRCPMPAAVSAWLDTVRYAAHPCPRG